MKTPSAFLRLALAALTLAAAAWGRADEPLNETRLREIIATPHSEKPLVEALSIYPNARAYQIKVQNKGLGGAITHTTATATEKHVDGRYIVTDVQPAGPETKFSIVVEFDAETSAYRKYVLMDGRYTGYQQGTRVGKSRTVSWIDLSPVKFNPGDDCLTTETHTDTSTNWLSMFYHQGILFRAETGTATATP